MRRHSLERRDVTLRTKLRRGPGTSHRITMAKVAGNELEGLWWTRDALYRHEKGAVYCTIVSSNAQHSILKRLRRVP